MVNWLEELANDNFLRILLEVCQKTCYNGMIQNSRMIDLWKRHLGDFEAQYHEIRSNKFDKNDFAGSTSARIEILEHCANVLVDTYWAIKMVAITLFQSIPSQLAAHFPAFATDVDIELFKLKIAERFVNSLMAFFAVEKDLLSPDLFIYGKINTSLRVKKTMTLADIASMITKDGVNFTPYVIHGVMTRFQELGLVEIDPATQGVYKHVKKLELSPDQEKLVQSRFMPLVEWAVETWRTVFNIRELNTPIPDFYERKDALVHVVSYAATQGFTTAHFCLVEIKKYYMALSGKR
jgi:hypothetical protein